MNGRVALFGSGLIGGSFALALKARGAVREVIGIDRDPAVLERALALGVIDTAWTKPEAALRGCELVLLAAPVAQTRAILASLEPWLVADMVVTDAGSTKADVIAAARAVLGAKIGQFVPGHPLAGREKHGPEAARADLFEGKKVVLTRLPENSDDALARVRNAWEVCGASVLLLEAARHDQVLAAVSHLPHLLAYALVAQVAGAPDGPLKMSLAGGGFRDFTRIAASSPEMWRDIAVANRSALLVELDAYLAVLAEVRRDLEHADGAALEALFSRASQARVDWEGPQ